MLMTLRDWMEENDYEVIEDILDDLGFDDSVVPALCTEGCEVEPDGICPHGGKSVLLAMGVI